VHLRENIYNIYIPILLHFYMVKIFRQLWGMGSGEDPQIFTTT
jgi:hypothetical protein